MSLKTILAIVAVVIIGILIIQVLGVIVVAITKNNVYGGWLEVRNQYKRQADLIPMLVNLTYTYMSYEHQTFLDVVNARAEALKNALTGDDVQLIDSVGDNVNTMSTQVLAIMENYPDLKASAVVMTTMDEIAGTQNRITVARKRYNDSVINFNNMLIIFPLAKLFGHSDLRGLSFPEVTETPPTIPPWEP